MRTNIMSVVVLQGSVVISSVVLIDPCVHAREVHFVQYLFLGNFCTVPEAIIWPYM